MGSSGCETTGLVALRGEDKQGCIGLVPAAALRERKINVELATKTLQDVAQGKFHLGYEDTIRTLLSDEILREWVRQEMICQGAKAFDRPEQQLWYLTMREIANKGTSLELLEWLKANPIDKFTDKLAATTYEIASISGHVVLPEDALNVKVGSITISGVLIIPGITTVFIENCSGTIRHSPKARIVVRNSSISCKQEHLK